MIAADIACILKRAHTAQAWRGRNPAPLGKFHIGDPPVILKVVKDLPIDPV